MKTTNISNLLVAVIWVIAGICGWAQETNGDTLTWENRASMNQIRAYFPGLAANGKIYAFGGITGVDGSLFILTDQIEAYDVEADTWTVTGVLPQPMYSMAVAELNGAIYIIGGSTDPGGFTASHKVYRYFPDSGTFDADTIASLPAPRAFLSVSALDGMIYAIGGSDGWLGNVKKDVYVYDPLLNEWITVQSLSDVVAGHTSVTFGGTIYLMGGTSDWFNGQNQVLGFDTLTGNWEPLANPLNRARVSHGSAVISNNIYAFGGFSSATSNELAVETVSDIHTGNSWEVIGELPYNRRAFGYASVENGVGGSFIYIFGGRSDFSTLASTQRFSIMTVAVEEPLPQDMVDLNHLIVFPNPFNGSTTLEYNLANATHVNISIYTTDGKLVAKPVLADQLPGTYRVLFEGVGLESGVYFCKFNTRQRESEVVKMILLR